MIRRSALSLLLALACALVPAGAQASSREHSATHSSKKDLSATHAYIVANYALIRAARANIQTAEASVAELTHKVGEECPHVAAESPQNHESERLADEVAGALWSIVYHEDSVAISRFVQAVKPLRWSNHKLTRIAASYAKSLEELAALPAPNLCADVGSWTSSGFHVLPASTTQFDQHLDAIGASSISPKLLARYEKPSDKGIASRMSHLETLLERAESSIGFDDWSSLLEALGLNQ